MEFWKLIEYGRNYFEKEMFIEAEQCFMQAEELRPDGKFLTDIIEYTDNFKPEEMDLNDLNSLEVQEYRVNLKSIKILKDSGTIGNDIYEYIAKQLPVIENIAV